MITHIQTVFSVSHMWSGIRHIGRWLSLEPAQSLIEQGHFKEIARVVDIAPCIHNLHSAMSLHANTCRQCSCTVSKKSIAPPLIDRDLRKDSSDRFGFFFCPKVETSGLNLRDRRSRSEHFVPHEVEVKKKCVFELKNGCTEKSETPWEIVLSIVMKLRFTVWELIEPISQSLTSKWPISCNIPQIWQNLSTLG